MGLADLRKDYQLENLTEAEAGDDPIALFARWFQRAVDAGVPEPNVMSLATVGPDLRPSSRIVLIKDFGSDGFTWYTNYASRKGQDLLGNPHAALLFHWIPLERQVRIEGRVTRVDAAASDAYFDSRPLKSRIGAIASAQSQPIADRDSLETRFALAERQYGDTPPRPEHWGGYRLQPDAIEFWQGRSSRLHDRILFTLNKDGYWNRLRLQP